VFGNNFILALEIWFLEFWILFLEFGNAVFDFDGKGTGADAFSGDFELNS